VTRRTHRAEPPVRIKPALLPRLLRSSVNIGILLSALVLTPLLALSHFNATLASMLGDVAERYLPNPTLFQANKKSRAEAESRSREKRVADARQRAAKKRIASAGSKVASNKGRRVLLRGAGALAVGWVPVLGVSADVYSMSEDFSDICQLFAVMDELLQLLYVPEANLYEENLCNVPQQGIERLQRAAEDIEFPWDASYATEVSPAS
jgi:hypothetical protein